MSDPNFDDVALLVHFDGANGSTDFPDSSDFANDGTVVGGAQIDITYSKFGGASGEFDGNGDAVDFYDSNAGDYQLGSSDFTIEFWCRFNQIPGVGSYMTLLCHRVSATPSENGWSVFYEGGDKLQFWYSDGTTHIGKTSLSTVSLAGNTWYHVAVVRDGNDLDIYVDGTKGTTETLTDTINYPDSKLVVGAARSGVGNYNSEFNGWLDDLRITIGTARYTSNFTKPSAAFPDFGTYETRTAIPSLLGSPAALLDLTDNRNLVVSIPSLLGSPAVLAAQIMRARISLPSPLGAPTISVQNDFTSLLTDETQQYIVKLTGTPDLEVPVSSWQATLQTGRQDFVQCVVPGADDLADAISALVGSSEIVVYRRGYIGSTVLDVEMARAALATAIINSGPSRTTITISGYKATASSVPSVTQQLAQVRQTTQTVGGDARVRASIDWLLKPGQTVQAGSLNFVANYINYFVPSTGDAYMDVGSRG